MPPFCIEKTPSHRCPQICLQCGNTCGTGRRRDPYGSFFCSTCGKHVQDRLRKIVQQSPLLTYFVVSIPGFLRYCPPSLIGLGDVYREVQFQYKPPPETFPKHKARPIGFPSECHCCGMAKRCFEISPRGLHLRHQLRRLRSIPSSHRREDADGR